MNRLIRIALQKRKMCINDFVYVGNFDSWANNFKSDSVLQMNFIVVNLVCTLHCRMVDQI